MQMVDQTRSHQRVTMTAITFNSGQCTEPHSHRRRQLVYSVSGIMEVTAESKQWRVPPQRAVWIPPYFRHSMQTHGAVELRTLYIPSSAVSNRFSGSPTMNAVSPPAQRAHPALYQYSFDRTNGGARNTYNLLIYHRARATTRGKLYCTRIPASLA